MPLQSKYGSGWSSYPEKLSLHTSPSFPVTRECNLNFSQQWRNLVGGCVATFEMNFILKTCSFHNYNTAISNSSNDKPCAATSILLCVKHWKLQVLITSQVWLKKKKTASLLIYKVPQALLISVLRVEISANHTSYRGNYYMEALDQK